jgi:regulator of cell morphogenesis and NO signaling
LHIKERKIGDLLKENFSYGCALYYLGIHFYQYDDRTLEEVCREKGLDVNQVVKKLKTVAGPAEDVDPSLFALPIDLVVEYLKQEHHRFVKTRLSYISSLINSIEVIGNPQPQLVEDLKFVFPIFVEDFIHHVYEEEDTLFDYILQLNQALDSHHNHPVLYFRMEDNALQEYAVHHEMHEDEMAGIRKITNQYDTSNKCLLLHVIFKELKAFEQELLLHAKIENEILFPKSLMLEKRVKAMIEKRINLN